MIPVHIKRRGTFLFNFEEYRWKLLLLLLLLLLHKLEAAAAAAAALRSRRLVVRAARVCLPPVLGRCRLPGHSLRAAVGCRRTRRPGEWKVLRAFALARMRIAEMGVSVYHSVSSHNSKEASRVVTASEQEPAPTSPVFESDGFVIRAWQHPSSLRSPPKVNDKFASTFPVTGPGFSRPQPHKIERDLWPEAVEGQGATSISASGSAGARSRSSAGSVGVGDVSATVVSTAPKPTPRELYRQRQRWIRSYEEHSSELRSHTMHEAEQVVPLALDDSPVTNPTVQDQILPVAGVELPVAAPQDEPRSTESQASQTIVSMCDACTQTETVERDCVSCQTEQAVAINQEPQDASAPSVLSATEQLAALDGKSPSMEELDRLERLLQAEHRKIMGDLATLPEEETQQQQQQQQQSDVLKSTHEEWLAQTQGLPSVEEGVEAEINAAQELVARRVEGETDQLYTSEEKFSDSRNATSVDNNAQFRRDVKPLDTVATTATSKTVQQDSAIAAEFETAATTSDTTDEPHEYPYSRETLAVDERLSRRVPIHKVAPEACTGFEQPMMLSDSPSTGSDGYASGANSMEAAHTSLESLAELEALLEEQHKQLIARGLIPADTPGAAERPTGAQA
eukprot:COSAG02_NODE_7932_length_2780_cov_1.744498_2_plen_624_part_00